jgi:hypothetical protein
VTDEAITRTILKFVRQLDGGETEDLVLEAAIARHWLNREGYPTPAGLKLIDEFVTMEQVARQRA